MYCILALGNVIVYWIHGRCIIFDAHSHVVPVDFYNVDPVDDSRWPTTHLVEGGERCTVMTGGTPYRTIKRTAWDMDARRTDLAGKGVQRQVVSLMPYLMMYWLEPRRAGRYCSEVNGRLAELTGGAGVFAPLGTLPMQDVPTAVAMIREEVPDGIRGFQVGTNVAGRPISSPEFEPVFEALQDHGYPLFIHSVAGACQVACPAEAQSSLAFPSEIGLAVAGLIAQGVLERFPGLRILASHGGGSIVAILPRLRHTWEAKEALRAALPRDPLEYAQQMYFDSLTFSVESFEYLVSAIGGDRVVLGTDYPFLGRGIGDTVPDGDMLTVMAGNATGWLDG